jgi:hypothetical protein
MSINVNELEQKLFEAGSLYGTDKVLVHGYHKYYARHLCPLFSISAPKILELGIGEEDRALGGASLYMWRDVFSHAQVFGVDVFDKRALNGERVTALHGDIADRQFLQTLIAEHGPFDLIIDDASHRTQDSLVAMFELIPTLKPSGLYVVEDCYSSYWPTYGGSALLSGYLDTPIRWAKLAIDMVNRNAMPTESLLANRAGWRLSGVSCYPGLCFFEAGETRQLAELASTGFIDVQQKRDVDTHGHLRGVTEQLFVRPGDSLLAIHVSTEAKTVHTHGNDLSIDIAGHTLEQVNVLASRHTTLVEQLEQINATIHAQMLEQKKSGSELRTEIARTFDTTQENWASVLNAVRTEAEAIQRIVAQKDEEFSNFNGKMTIANLEQSNGLLKSELRTVEGAMRGKIDEFLRLIQGLEKELARTKVQLAAIKRARGFGLLASLNGFRADDLS